MRASSCLCMRAYAHARAREHTHAHVRVTARARDLCRLRCVCRPKVDPSLRPADGEAARRAAALDRRGGHRHLAGAKRTSRLIYMGRAER
eukprot:463820-Pleurochrysis_carterae.AAC.1